MWLQDTKSEEPLRRQSEIKLTVFSETQETLDSSLFYTLIMEYI